MQSKVIIRNMKLGRSVFEHRVRTDIPGLRMYADMVLPQFKLIIEVRVARPRPATLPVPCGDTGVTFAWYAFFTV